MLYSDNVGFTVLPDLVINLRPVLNTLHLQATKSRMIHRKVMQDSYLTAHFPLVLIARPIFSATGGYDQFFQ